MTDVSEQSVADDGRPVGEGFDADGNCMICSGDCAGANPPVLYCPYEMRRLALLAAPRAGEVL